jgi:hypothetical protein
MKSKENLAPALLEGHRKNLEELKARQEAVLALLWQDDF